MATQDRSIFRPRAIEKHVQRQELQVMLRLVSPPMFRFLWVLLLLTICAGVLASFIQEPVVVEGKGIVVQRKAANAKSAPDIVVLLLLPPDKQASLKVGQSVSISIASTNITFTSTIEKVEGVMSPNEISTGANLSVPLAQTVAGPSTVATAHVEPMSLAKTYLGSQCQAQIQIGSESALTLLPGYVNLPDVPAIFNNISQNFQNLFKKSDSGKGQGQATALIMNMQR